MNIKPWAIISGTKLTAEGRVLGESMDACFLLGTEVVFGGSPIQHLVPNCMLR